MKTHLLPFYALRVYKNLTTPQIINGLLCNKFMKSPWLVSNSPIMYEKATKILGTGIPSWFLEKTFCKLFTAGNTINETDKIASYYRRQNVAVILDYCVEGYLNNKQFQVALDSNAEQFLQTAKHLMGNKNQMISIKISGLIDMTILKKMNDAVLDINRFWKQNSKDGSMNAQQFFGGLVKKSPSLTEELFKEYLAQIHNYKQDLANFKIDQFTFKMNHQPFYIEMQKNQNFVVKLFFPLTKDEKSKANNLIKRIHQICDPIADNPHNLRILVDAEQTYIQLAIQSISEQMQAKYNKNGLYIIPTIQNYLKTSIQRVNYQIKIAKAKNLVFGAKLVRGAYIVQQTKIAKQNNIPSPIVDNFEATSTNYHHNLDHILREIKNGEVVVATHNQDTIRQAQSCRQKYPNGVKLSFAQLLGLADHLTWQLKERGETVYKLLPWAKTDVMVAYMIRRAQELQQMRYPLDIQRDLLIHQLKSRYL